MKKTITTIVAVALMTIIVGCSGDPGIDTDSDGVVDIEDNCPNIANEDQLDNDYDLVGDACDECGSDVDNSLEYFCDENGVGIGDCEPQNDIRDADGQVIEEASNICMNATPCDQIRDGCNTATPSISVPDKDIDDDGLWNVEDNCPDIANSDQADTDDDGVGDACDQCADESEIFVGGRDNDEERLFADCISMLCIDGWDQHGNMFGGCEPTTFVCTAQDGTRDGCGVPTPVDSDSDGIEDEMDNCPDIANPDQMDADNDGIGDACEVRTLPGVELRKPDYEFELNIRPQLDFEIAQPQIPNHDEVML
jgi:thrombospondin 2/3/4/5